MHRNENTLEIEGSYTTHPDTMMLNTLSPGSGAGGGFFSNRNHQSRMKSSAKRSGGRIFSGIMTNRTLKKNRPKTGNVVGACTHNKP